MQIEFDEAQKAVVPGQVAAVWIATDVSAVGPLRTRLQGSCLAVCIKSITRCLNCEMYE